MSIRDAQVKPLGRRRRVAFNSKSFKRTKTKRGFMLLPRGWLVERSFSWAVRFRRLARD